MKRLLLSFIPLLLFFPAWTAADDPTILPPDNAIAGWKKVEVPKRFTEADLYGYIDGGAELFLEYGFEQLTVQKYRNGTDDVTLEAYRMIDPAAAMGVYLMKAGRERPVAGFRERHTANRYQLMFCRSRYFVIVNNVSGKEALAPVEEKFAAFVASKVPPRAPIPELDALPREGLVPGSTRLVRGAYGLQSVYTLGDGDILLLERKLTATSGDYRTPAGGYTLIVARYADPAQARRAFEHLQTNLDTYLKVIDQRPGRFVFEDYSKKFGLVTLSGRTLQIKVKLAQKP
jgi:hypothetical protein